MYHLNFPRLASSFASLRAMYVTATSSKSVPTLEGVRFCSVLIFSCATNANHFERAFLDTGALRNLWGLRCFHGPGVLWACYLALLSLTSFFFCSIVFISYAVCMVILTAHIYAFMQCIPGGSKISSSLNIVF